MEGSLVLLCVSQLVRLKSGSRNYVRAFCGKITWTSIESADYMSYYQSKEHVNTFQWLYKQRRNHWAWILDPWCSNKLLPLIPKLAFLQKGPLFLGSQWERPQPRAYKWTVFKLDPFCYSWSLGWGSKWPTQLPPPLAVAAEMPWSKALNPLLMLLHAKEQQDWLRCSSLVWV